MDEVEENDIEALESALSMLGQNKVKGKMSRVLVRIFYFFCYRVKNRSQNICISCIVN